MTRTFATLEVNGYIFQTIKNKLIEAGYGHAIIRSKDGITIDMHGLALKEAPVPVCQPGWSECNDSNCHDWSPDGNKHCHENKLEKGTRVKITVMGEVVEGVIDSELETGQYKILCPDGEFATRSRKRIFPI